MTAATGLRRFRTPDAGAATRCELCGEPAGEDHGHVVNLETRALLCACACCHLLFSHDGDHDDRDRDGGHDHDGGDQGGGDQGGARDGGSRRRYRGVPRRHLHAPSFPLTEADWEEMRIPVRTAFFFRNSALGRIVACYPSPAGATESLLPHDVWERVLTAVPEMAGVLPDVEALLVDRRPQGGFACHLAPIDACYRLVGLVRLHWKGFDGGPEVWRAIDGFFADLRRRGRRVPWPDGRGAPEHGGDGHGAPESRGGGRG
ncbi:DUF5947 family protein [Streptosporangium sp. NPDC048047]|uniref:DUF5947 family protein n=1 Tax=Streptosporangium sp. NPDC048047 TaxID=3155748 RepID=UPI0034148C00